MVSKNIKAFREKKNMTQQELADRLCMTRQAVSNWENGKTEPDIETLSMIATVLGVSIEELIYGVGRNSTIPQQVTKRVSDGISFGAALAMVISYARWQSIGWAILHGTLSWCYVLYYIIRY